MSASEKLFFLSLLDYRLLEEGDINSLCVINIKPRNDQKPTNENGNTNPDK